VWLVIKTVEELDLDENGDKFSFEEFYKIMKALEGIKQSGEA